MVVCKKRGAVLVEPLGNDRRRRVCFLHRLQKFRRCAAPVLFILHKRHQPKRNRRYAFPCKLFLPFSLHQLPTARTEAQDKLLILDVPAHTVEPCCIGSPRFLFQNKGRICAPRQPCCSRYLVEHIAVVLLADMVDNYHCKGMSCPQTP